MKISSAGKVGYWCKARENLFIQCQVWGEKFIAQLLIAIEDLQSDIELLTDFSWLSKHFLGIAESIKEMHQLTRKGPFVSFDVSWRKFAMCFFNFFGEMILTRIPQLKRRAYHLLSAISLLHSNEGPALETSCFTIFLRFMNSLDETQCLCLTSQPTRTTTFFIWPKCSNVSLFGSSSAPGGGGGYAWEFRVEVCRPALQILTLFQIKIFDYSHLFSDLASHENLYPFSDPAPKKLCHHYLD